MDTGNNTAGKTAPERYVSEKAFEELARYLSEACRAAWRRSV